MALTPTIKRQGVVGNLRYSVTEFDFDSSYPTGGLPVTAGNFGYPGGTIQFVVVSSKSGYVFSFDYAGLKLLAYQQTDPAAAGGANVPLVQVSNTTNLSTLTGVRCFALISGA